MAFTIQGEGSDGRISNAGVDNKKRLQTFSITEPEDKYANKEDGKVWSLNSNTTAAGAGDYIFYMKNTGDKVLAITDIRAKAAAATLLHIEVVSGTPSYTASSDVVAVSRNLGRNNSPSATIKQDTDITGLTASGVLFFLSLEVAEKQYKLSTTSNIIIPQGFSIAIRSSVSTAVEMITSLVDIS